MYPHRADLPVILYFGNDWFAENRTSSHHVARWLARRHSVYYIECPGLRAPSGSARDIKKIFRKLWNALRGVRATAEGPKVITLLQVPLHRFRLVRWLNRLLTRASIRWLMWRQRIRDRISWFVVPHLPYLVGRLGERLSVYYCVDDYAALPGVDPAPIRAMDEETTRRADLVFVVSETLLDAKRSLNPSTFTSPHGVDFEHFRRAQDNDLVPPPDASGLPKPIVGYFGSLENWIDFDLIDYLAEQRPHWTFLLIGRAAVAPDRLPRRSNVHLLGQRPYEFLPAYGKLFDAAIIPFRINQQTLHCNPLKLREYLAMGKPIVSVDVPEIRKHADLVSIANSREDFLAKLDAALARPSSTAEVARRMDHARAVSWSARLKLIETGSRHRRTGPRRPYACRNDLTTQRGKVPSGERFEKSGLSSPCRSNESLAGGARVTRGLCLARPDPGGCVDCHQAESLHRAP